MGQLLQAPPSASTGRESDGSSESCARVTYVRPEKQTIPQRSMIFTPWGLPHLFPMTTLPGTKLPVTPLHPKSSILRSFPFTTQSCVICISTNLYEEALISSICTVTRWQTLRRPLPAELSVTTCPSYVSLEPGSQFNPALGLAMKLM